MKLKIPGLIIFTIMLAQGADSQVSLGGYGGFMSSNFVSDPPPMGFYNLSYSWKINKHF